MGDGGNKRTDPNLPAIPGVRGIGGHLVRARLITPEQLDAASEEVTRTGKSLPRVLIEQGLLTGRAYAEFLAQHHGVELFELGEFDFAEESALHEFDREFCEGNRVVPVYFDDSDIVVVMADPGNVQIIDDIQFKTGRRVKVMVAPEDQIERAIKRFYGVLEDDRLRGSVGEIVDVDGDVELDSRIRPVVDVADLERDAKAEPVVKLVYMLILTAITRRASDIHIEPYDHELRVRLRIDGDLYEVIRPPWRLRHAIVSRIKVLCGLDISERRLPQDGRMRLKFSDGRSCDFRVNVTPFQYGEKVVIRLLDKANLRADLTALGLDPADLDLLKRMINQPHGMILVTGPTGSGKTTTLYSALLELNRSLRNISTAEDPVEYDLPGINQMPINPAIGLTFAEALRSFLRQDPDVILLGEIRDYETADVAFQAAQTGHLVFSTLHTNDAPSTVVRLTSMGVDAFRLSASLRLIVAQRLVRRVCPHCRRPHQWEKADCLSLGLTEQEYTRAKTMIGAGCRECRGTGYLGRVAVYELMPVTNAIRQAINNSESAEDIRRLAIQAGMRTLGRAALDKFVAGITTYDEVLRVMGDRED